MLYCKCTDLQQVFTVHLMHYEVARSESRSKRFKEQLQRPSMHRDGECREVSESLLRSNDRDRACIATERAAQTMHRYSGATAVIEHASRQREERRLAVTEHASRPCISMAIATARAAQTTHRSAKQRQRQSMPPDGESSVG